MANIYMKENIKHSSCLKYAFLMLVSVNIWISDEKKLHNYYTNLHFLLVVINNEWKDGHLRE